MSKKLLKYASTSELMNLEIKYGGKVYKFNLFEEIQITEQRLNRELKEQASSYSFLTMLHKALVKRYEKAEAEKKKRFAQLYIKFKSENKAANGRNISDDLAKQMVESNKLYIKVVSNTIQYKYEMTRIEAALKSFEQRKDMLQSLSANIRIENKVNS